MPVKPLAPVVKIQPQQGKGQLLLYLAGLLQNTGCTAVPDRSTAGPSAGDIRKGQAPDEVAGQTAAAMSHAVGLQETRPLLIPNLPLNRNLLSQQIPRFGPAQTP